MNSKFLQAKFIPYLKRNGFDFAIENVNVFGRESDVLAYKGNESYEFEFKIGESDFRKDIKSYLDKVAINFETLIINRGKDSDIVIMSLTEYNSLMATNHELSSRANEIRLDSAIEKLKAHKSFEKILTED